MNPPEMIVDDIYNAGCFEITDLSLLGEGAEFDNVAGFKPIGPYTHVIDVRGGSCYFDIL